MGLKEFLDSYGTSEHSLPRIIGSYTGNLVVCGDAACIWDDLERFGCKSGNGVARGGWQFMTVNRLVEVFPGYVEHCYSNSALVLRRHIRGRRDDYEHEFGKPRHSHSRTEGTDHIWPWHGGGSSGLGAVLVGIALGYTRIVIAGMPLDDGPHNGEPKWRRTRFTNEVKNDDTHWRTAIALAFQGRVKSLSGRTQEWLGSP